MKKIAILLLFMAYSTMIIHAQDIQIIAEFKEIANIRQQNNGKLSLNNEQNKPIITDIDSIFPTRNVFYHVIKNGKHGIYYKSGKQCIPIEYDEIDEIKASYYASQNDYWLVRKGKNVGLYSHDGNQILPPIYLYIEQKRVDTSQETDYFIVKKEHYGICDAKGNIVVAPIYAYITYTNGFWTLRKETPCDYIFNDKDIVKGITINQTKGPIYYDYKHSASDYSFEKDGLWGVINSEGLTIIKPQYEKELLIMNNLNNNRQVYFIAYQNRCYGMIDIDNNIILPFSYKSIKQIDDNGIVKLDDIQGKKKLFSMKKMQMLTNSSYDNVQAFSSYCILEKDGLKAFFDADEEKILLPLAYESITTNMYKSTFIVSKGKKFGIVNRENKTLVPFEYDNISSTPNDSLFIVEKENEQGVIDLDNDIRIKLKPCKIKTFFNRLEIRELTTDTIIQKLDYNLKEIK